MNGVFLINKEKGWTSFDVCAKLRRMFSTKKVGHCGTLDPFAEGLMLVFLGHATKIIAFTEDKDKVYETTIELGKETDTLDCTGKVISECEVKDFSNQEIENVLHSFLGKSQQMPPMYSAIKNHGVPLYLLAREGIEVDRKAREIEIYSIELISYQKPFLSFRVHVSKGTYIRSLAKDIALKLSTVGHLVTLKRLSIGKYNLSQAKNVNDVTLQDSLEIKDVLSQFTSVVVDEKTEEMIHNGTKISLERQDEMLLLLNKKQQALAIYELREDGFYYCKRGLFDANNNI